MQFINCSQHGLSEIQHDGIPHVVRSEQFLWDGRICQASRNKELGGKVSSLNV